MKVADEPKRATRKGVKIRRSKKAGIYGAERTGRLFCCEKRRKESGYFEKAKRGMAT